jgi:antiviral helicase SKI2
VFAFSRPKCDSRAEKLVEPSDTLLSPNELEYVNEFVSRALSRIDEEDHKLPQIIFVRNLLSQGVGVHHSGILPILKEIVEILFSEGVLKVLVATETFSVGLNMPTKTVVFCGVKKFDGNTWRNMSPAEYT